MHLKSLSAIAVGFLLAGCGGSLDGEEEVLIPQSELSGLQEAAVPPRSVPPVTQRYSARVKIVWGYLAGWRDAPAWIDWSGSLTAPGGQANLERLVYFDRHDHMLQSSGADRLTWSSRTRPHFDGFVARVDADAGSPALRFATPSFSHEVPIAQLAEGVNLHFVVDAAGHEVGITSLPADVDGGFAYGYERPAAQGGWLALAGRMTGDAATLRFRIEGSRVQARLLGANDQLLASGSGTATTEPGGGRFKFSIVDADGRTREFQGLYRAPSYSRRGSFQATWRRL